MGILAEFLGYQPHQAFFHFDNIFSPRNAGPVGDAKNVGVDCNRWLSEGGVQDDIGCLPAHTGQAFEFFPRLRHLAAMLVPQDSAGRDDVLCLVAE